jgi:hypothetical protein
MGVDLVKELIIDAAVSNTPMLRYKTACHSKS